MRLVALLLSMAPSVALAATEKAAHGEAEGGGSLPQFDVTTFPSQIFWLTVLMLVVYGVVSRVIFPQIDDAVMTRESHINGMLQDAGALNEKARVTQANYEQRIAQARENARDTLNHARNSIAVQLAQSETSQKAHFAEHRTKFKAEYEAKKEAASVSLANEARTLAESVVARLLSPSGGKNRKAA